MAARSVAVKSARAADTAGGGDGEHGSDTYGSEGALLRSRRNKGDGEHGSDTYGSEGERGADLWEDETDALSEPVGDRFAVEGERGGPLAIPGLKPLVEDGRRGWVD